MKAVVDSSIVKTTDFLLFTYCDQKSGDSEDIYCGYGIVLCKYITRDQTVPCRQELTSIGLWSHNKHIYRDKSLN